MRQRCDEVLGARELHGRFGPRWEEEYKEIVASLP